jgi:hypothetical protein
MIEKVKEIKNDLGIENKTDIIMDAGYFSEVEIIKNKDDETIEVIVPDKKESGKTKKEGVVPALGFEVENFKYNKELDIFYCPSGKKLTKTHTNPGHESSGKEVFEYHCYDCGGCERRPDCTNNKRGRSIKVSVHREYMNKFKESMKSKMNKRMIGKRKEIIEHPFGTIKRNFGYEYFMQRGIEKVKAEFSFICFIYNFKRVMKILGIKGFLKAIEDQKQIKLAVN